MVRTVRPKASATPANPIPSPGNAAASTADPHPPNTSQNVPINSANDLLESGMLSSSLLTTDATIRHMKRREFLAGCAAAAAAAQSACEYVPASSSAASAPPAFELDELSITELGSGLAKGRWTSERLVNVYLARIDAIDRKGPQL